MQAAESVPDGSLTGEGVKALLVWSHQEKLNGHFVRVRRGTPATLYTVCEWSDKLGYRGFIDRAMYCTRENIAAYAW